MSRIGADPPALPKRFYNMAALGDGGAVLLDGRPARTRARRALAAPPALAAAIVNEWNAQGEAIDFLSMPMTRFQMTVLDRAAADAGVWRDATLSFLRSDLLCYRAAAPTALVARQQAAWDPLLRWAQEQGVSLRIASGLSFIEQPRAAIAAGDAFLRAAPAPRLLAMKSAAEISGSAVIAFALGREAFDALALFQASRVDEDFQAGKWGEDPEAQARAHRLKTDFLDAARYSSLAGTGD